MLESSGKDLLDVADTGCLHTGYDDIKSSCGNQVDSRKKTAPMASFGSSTRPKPIPNAQKVPGPGAYQIPPSIGKSVISTAKTAPQCSISGREKFGSTADLKEASNMPGPGDYNSRIVNPKEKAAPQYSLGKRWKPDSDKRQSPGPGSYTPSTHLSETLLSTQENPRRVKFGTGKRPPLLQTSTADVGPGQYKVKATSVGKQVTSTLPNTAAYSFSVVGRKKAAIGARMNHDQVPGPGSYKLKPAVGRQVISNLRSAPRCSMSGRNKFGSHF